MTVEREKLDIPIKVWHLYTFRGVEITSADQAPFPVMSWMGGRPPEVPDPPLGFTHILVEHEAKIVECVVNAEEDS